MSHHHKHKHGGLHHGYAAGRDAASWVEGINLLDDDGGDGNPSLKMDASADAQHAGECSDTVSGQGARDREAGKGGGGSAGMAHACSGRSQGMTWAHVYPAWWVCGDDMGDGATSCKEQQTLHCCQLSRLWSFPGGGPATLETCACARLLLPASGVLVRASAPAQGFLGREKGPTTAWTTRFLTAAGRLSTAHRRQCYRRP
eukprot:355862-Chlamydomonas_euryale.AAC.3